MAIIGYQALKEALNRKPVTIHEIEKDPTFLAKTFSMKRQCANTSHQTHSKQ